MPIDEHGVTKQPVDGVTLHLNATDEMFTVESYNFTSAIFQQPASFSLKLSGGHGAAAMLKHYPPGPEWGRLSLLIGRNKQFVGEIDAVDASGSAAGTYVNVKGRDLLSRLHSSDIPGDRTFKDVTYKQLFEAALKDVDLPNASVVISDEANQRVRLGYKVKTFKASVTADEINQQISGGGTRNVVTAKMGESWLHFLRRHFTKLGLFIWADTNGGFVLSRPNAEQEPMFNFIRKRGQGQSVSNVEAFRLTNDTTGRARHVSVFARGTGKRHGHNGVHGNGEDLFMGGLGFVRRRVYRDVNVVNKEEAAHYARMKIAEAARAGWKLQYTISGHSAPLMSDPKKRGVVIPNVIARVDDDELGIHENLYIESVNYQSPPRTTVITMMRLEDLVFSEVQAKAGATRAKRRVDAKIIDWKKTSTRGAYDKFINDIVGKDIANRATAAHLSPAASAKAAGDAFVDRTAEAHKRDEIIHSATEIPDTGSLPKK